MVLIKSCHVIGKVTAAIWSS